MDQKLHFHLDELKQFSAEKHVFSTFFENDTCSVYLNCWEPGQENTKHVHHHSDNVMLVLEGAGTFALNDRVVQLGAGTLIRVPAGTVHHIKNTSGKRMVTMHIYSPKLARDDVIPVG
jgi:mannose-6-phosphate isomerase-like protein (cupin superfamily)